MTVTIPSQDTQDLTPEYKREHVIAYLSGPHGTKTTYLIEHGINPKSIHRWKHAMADGNLEQGLIPRQTGVWVSFSEVVCTAAHRVSHFQGSGTPLMEPSENT
ncbi:hypothetical protein CFAEC_10060 [Corynebacterium faecale]|uniref:hypothetical protein n=1 Tax=Corynebacterium faecale TaxID=1758466 RepID=UPI0025B37A29|nr:hypothetical protein [Corynebacterium faecale]WJY92825.1 hypothetical protein CFAEC_10060 [Corynebacterium faecale]